MSDLSHLLKLLNVAQQTNGTLITENQRLREQNVTLAATLDAIRALVQVQVPVAGPIVPAPVEPAPVEPAPVEPAPVADADQPIRFLSDLRTYDLAPRAPRMKRGGRWLEPYWMPPAPHIVDQVRYAAFAWTADVTDADLVGAIRLDRSGAHVASAATVRVGFGPLSEHEAARWEGRPGYYRVSWAPWDEDGTPHPLGGAAAEAARVGSVWVPHTRVKLLADLAAQCRWPELGEMPAWIAEHEADLARWAHHINDARCAAIDRYGRDSAQYRAVKEGFSQAVSLMIGSRNVGEPRRWSCDVQRPDWAHAIRDFSACMMWRWCDDLRAVAIDGGRADYAPIAIRNQDELWVPRGSLDFFTSRERRPATTGGKPRRPLTIDETGKTLGTFKAKS